MTNALFQNWFERLTGHPEVRPWQYELATAAVIRSRQIRIPTGLGKTEGVLATWAYRVLHNGDDTWPRRLVWCLPMRTLVEQTAAVARRMFNQLPETERPNIHIVMGGEESGEWVLSPERPAVVVGTQDMLLSRALNRGYASGRARWPMEFGLLNQDALWVMDEVQLMDAGLVTSAQLQAFRDDESQKALRPCHTWWMSATLQPEWFVTVDTEPHLASWSSEKCEVRPTDRVGGLWEIQKSLELDKIGSADTRSFAQRVLDAHADISPNEFGRITLVVCNTVERACQTYDELEDRVSTTTQLELVHSRFRPAERERWQREFLSRSTCTSTSDRIIVATQVVEAGVDISAGCLITELAPWPSLVQRFGRCARYGGSGTVIVVDRRVKASGAAPYDLEVLDQAQLAVEKLQATGAGLSNIEEFEETLNSSRRLELYPSVQSQLLLRSEFDELFDTTPDLTGADLDISRFIRTGEETDLQVFWVMLGKDESPEATRRPVRRELCSIPFLKARDWLCGVETQSTRKPKPRKEVRAWIWDWIDGTWTPLSTRDSLLPGRLVCVSASCGGYRPERGFDPDSTELVPSAGTAPCPHDVLEFDLADDSQDGEELSFNPWKTIAGHTIEVVDEVRRISRAIGLPDELQTRLIQAAEWHDWGKSHPAFQGALRSNERPQRHDLAKGPEDAWRKEYPRYEYLDGSEARPGFRHELASALGLVALLRAWMPDHPALLGAWPEMLVGVSVGGMQTAKAERSSRIQQLADLSGDQFNLLAYLVASHHGKVRVALHPSPVDQQFVDRNNDRRGFPIRGCREGDRLPPVSLLPGEPPLPEVELSLSPASMGLSPGSGMSWRERCLKLQHGFGPCGLAFLEAILRSADVRASRLVTNDPVLGLDGARRS